MEASQGGRINPPAPATSGNGGTRWGGADDSIPGIGGREISTTAAPAQGERRQLSVLFCDLVSFTELSQSLDEEDLNAVVNEYYGVCRAVSSRYDGHVANYTGDGVMVLFGYPKAQEQDAHRAVQTGLGMVEAMEALSDRLERELGRRLPVRVGIHTGLVIVGDEGEKDWSRMASGETLNIAARLQTAAPEDTVVVSDATRELIEGYFAYTSLGVHQLKGLSAPMAVYKVTHESTARGRLDAAGRSTLTPLTGREREIHELVNEWREASEGSSRAVLLMGEGGIGKSRLVQMLQEHVASLTNAWMTPCQCSPYHQSTAMYPYIDLIERVVLKFDRKDSPRDRLNKLEGMIVQYGFDPAESLPIFAVFHSLPPEAGYEPSDLPPAQQRRLYMDAMRRILDERSVKQPLLFVVEDLHWVDPTTKETLVELVDSLRDQKMLVVFTARPDFAHPWQGHPKVRVLELERLDRGQTRAICQRVARGKRLPEEVVDEIIERADGVPLFAEELTKMIIGSGLLEEHPDRWQLTGPLPPLAIPSTLQDSLMARLDRLSAVKEIAQIAAVIGREFSYELIRYVYPIEDARLRHFLEELEDAEIIEQSGTAPGEAFTFTHALVREAAYQSLVKGRRRHFHRLVAHALEQHFAEVVEAEPEIMAHHYTKAHLGWQAIPYLQRAGERASARSSHREAISLFERGLELAGYLKDDSQRWQHEIRLLIGMGASLTAICGYGADEVEKTYARARDLCEQHGTPGQLFQARYGLWRLHMLRAEYETATRNGEELLGLAKRQDSRAFLIAAHRALGATLFYRGKFEDSCEHVRRVIELAGSEGENETLIRDIYDVVDPRVTCHSYLSWNLWMLGYLDQAQEESERANALAERLKHPFSIALAASFRVWLEQLCGRVSSVSEKAEQAIKYCYQHDFGFWIGWHEVLIGWARSRDGDPEGQMVELMQRGLDNWKEKGSRLGCGYFYCLIAEAHLLHGETTQAMDVLARARAFMEETDERCHEAELNRLVGVLTLVLQPEGRTAAKAFYQAIDLAEKQHARMFELRARTSLAGILSGPGEGEKNLARLRVLLEEVEGGEGQRDLIEAQELLSST